MLFACSDPLAPASLSSGFFPLSHLLVGYIHSTSSLFFQISKLSRVPGSLATLLPLRQFLFMRLSHSFSEHLPHSPLSLHLWLWSYLCYL